MSCLNEWFGCQKRTKIEIFLFLLISCCTVVILCLTIAIYGVDSSIEQNDQDTVCVTETCVRSASTILEKIDESVGSCDDFYDFVCGKFVNKTTIPEEKTIVDSFSLLKDKVNRQLQTILAEPFQDGDPKPLKLLKMQYKSCMNITKIEKDGVRFLRRFFKEMGGWPLMDQVWNEKKFDWKQLLYRLRRSGWRPTFFIQMGIEPDMKNSSRRILTITQPRMLPYNILTKGVNDTYVQAYYDYMVNLATLYGASTLSASVEMKEVLTFEINLAKNLVPNSGVQNLSSEYNVMTIRNLQGIVQTIPWLQLINNYLAPIEVLTSKDFINVACLPYLKSLEDLLLNTKKRIIANYMFLKLLRDSLPHLPQKFRYEEMKYLRIVQGKTRLNSRWEQCVWEVDKLSVAASAIYVKKFFNKSNRKKVADIAEDVRSAFVETVRESDWLDPETKKHALLKAEKMEFFLGYPDELLDEDKVEEYYKGLELNSNDYYLKMSFNLSTFVHMKNVKKLREPVNKTDWTSHVRSYYVNAFYDEAANAVNIAAAVMQDNFFDPKRPQYMNYGSIGGIIAHEILHGFDNTGRQYDENGNLVSWWSNETLDTFNTRAECFIEQYSNVTVPEFGLTLNGFHTLDENIADNGGFKMAYKAYLKWLARHTEEATLPAVSYTPLQTFWISAAMDGCAKYKEQRLKQLIVTGSHAPEKFRIMVSFQNLDEFGRDFNCSVGSTMNPADLCQVW